MKRILLFILLILFSASLFAAENYYYEDYSVSVELEENGTMHYSEDILVNFLRPMHGIYRDIQYIFDEADPFYPIIADVDNITVYGGVEAALSKEDDFYSIRLGSADRYTEGLQRYSFSYDFSLGADRYDGYDEFYQNMLSAANDFPIRHFSFSVRLPKKTDLSDSLWVTYGSYGSADQIPYTVSEDGLTISGELWNIRPMEAVTVRVQFPEGYYIGQKRTPDYTVPAKLITALLSVLLVLYAYSRYRKYGVDDELVTPVRFHAPDGISPIDADYLKNLRLNGARDTAAMLFYWADRGYVEIIDNGKKNFTIRALRPLESDSPDGKALYKMMFGSSFPAERTVKDLGKKNLPSLFSSKLPSILRKKYSKEKSLFDSASRSSRVMILAIAAVWGLINAAAVSIRYIGILFVLTAAIIIAGFAAFSFLSDLYVRRTNKGKSGVGAIIAICISAVLFTALMLAAESVFGPFAVGLIHGIVFSLSFVITVFIGYVTEKRSAYYNKKLEEILGYEDFIRTVEKDKLKIMIDEDPSVFYHVLGYAVAFGCADEWAKKFKGLYVEVPSWYYSSDPVLDYLVFSHFADKWSNAYRSEMALYGQNAGGKGHKGGSSFTSFGSSGFAGGGFSGGGSRGW